MIKKELIEKIKKSLITDAEEPMPAISGFGRLSPIIKKINDNNTTTSGKLDFMKSIINKILSQKGKKIPTRADEKLKLQSKYGINKI
jgi:hypothetical protein